MTRNYPPGTPDLPYVCSDPGCPCQDAQEGPHEPPRDTIHLRVTPAMGGWVLSVLEAQEGGVVEIDQFHVHDLTEGLAAVHREYPRATFDPEEA